MTREAMRAFQNERLRRVVSHAYANVAYYRELFDARGISPKDIRCAADLRHLPISSRQVLQSLPKDAVVARGVGHSRLISTRTSGSSGMPLTIWRSWLEQNLLHLFRLRAFRSFGLQLGDRMASVAPVREVHGPDNKTLGRLLRTFQLYSRQRVDNLQSHEEIVAELRRLKPDIVNGYPGVLSRLADVAGEANSLGIRCRFCITGAEVLTPLMRGRISKAFDAPVFNIYGCNEFNLVAWECAETGDLHNCDDSVIVEVIRDGEPVGPGERGEMVVTSLHSYAMPFIRYRLGDIVTRGEESCGCGSPFSTIRAIQGRMLDFFSLPGGRLMHPHELILQIVSERERWIGQYELVQEREDRVVMRVVPLFEAPSARASLRATLAGALGPAVEFEIQTIPEIPADPSGKFRVARSLVKSEHAGFDWNRTTSGSLIS